jgi:hypothetical protein
MQKYRDVSGAELQPSYVLLLLGQKDKARLTAKPYYGAAETKEWKDYYQATYDYRRGSLSDEAFLAITAGSRWQQCYARLAIGLNRLADGDRAGAREQFAKGFETRAIWLTSWNLCEMFLSRLDKDPNWPPRPAGRQ